MSEFKRTKEAIVHSSSNLHLHGDAITLQQRRQHDRVLPPHQEAWGVYTLRKLNEYIQAFCTLFSEVK